MMGSMSDAATTSQTSGTTFTLTAPAHLIPTPEHPHLYVDKPMDWPTYASLLKALATTGIVTSKWARSAIRHHQSVLPAPWLIATDRAVHLAGGDIPAHLPATPREQAIVARHFMMRTDTRKDARTHRAISIKNLRYTRLPAHATHIASRLTGNHPQPVHAPALALCVPATRPHPHDTEHARITFHATLSTRKHERLTAALTAAGLISAPERH